MFCHVEIDEKIQNIKFFSCSQIFIQTHYKDNIQHGISFYEVNKKQFRIYFLQDEVYTVWDHPTILYFISKFLAKALECEGLELEICTLFQLKSEDDIKRWLDNNLQVD